MSCSLKQARISACPAQATPSTSLSTWMPSSRCRTRASCRRDASAPPPEYMLLTLLMPPTSTFCRARWCGSATAWSAPTPGASRTIHGHSENSPSDGTSIVTCQDCGWPVPCARSVTTSVVDASPSLSLGCRATHQARSAVQFCRRSPPSSPGNRTWPSGSITLPAASRCCGRIDPCADASAGADSSSASHAAREFIVCIVIPARRRVPAECR